MPTDSTTPFADALRRARVLDAPQLDELTRDLQPRFSEPRALAAELTRRNWLTPYQASQLLQGRGLELLLGSYVLLELLGEGGFGAVFKARNWKLGSIVALKLIRKERLDHPDTVRRFHREIRAVSQLNHPNIVRALDADEVDGKHLLVMEYVQGVDLNKVVKKNGPLPAEKACDFCRQAALGLQHASERGLVHRDIKPSNLLLTLNGVVKILDMGLARRERASGDDEESSSMTREGTVMGSLDYIAPEQAMNSHTVDIRADLYSLGCTLYYLLTGRVPFPGGEALEKLMRHRLEEPIAVERIRPGVPAGVPAVVRRLMGKRPQARYQTAAEAAEALAAAGQGFIPAAPSSAAPPATAAGGGEWSFLDGTSSVADTVAQALPRRRTARRLSPWILVGTTVSVALMVLGLTGFFLILPRQPPPPPPPNSQPRTKEPAPDKHGDEAPFEKWLRDTAALPAERQGDVVEAELKRRNPGFDGVVKTTIENGVVTGLEFITDNVTDIAPVRALSGLQTLSCEGSNGAGRLSDLSPLKGMLLTYLDCRGTLVSDLTPLKGMKLTKLDCPHTRVLDLSPLRGMPLYFLECGDTQVADLSPLKDMKMTSLWCYNTPVSDLSPLKGMPLTVLECHGTQVSDLSPLKGMKLTTLNCFDAPVSDLSPLAGMPLDLLNCSNTGISDLSPLKGMPLTTLNCCKTQVADLSPLKNMKLTTMDCGDTKVADLSALAGMPLTLISLAHTPVSDLAPLKDMPLKILRFDGTKVADLSVLKTTPLQSIEYDYQPKRDAEILRSIKTLEAINGKPAAELLKAAGPPSPP